MPRFLSISGVEQGQDVTYLHTQINNSGVPLLQYKLWCPSRSDEGPQMWGNNRVEASVRQNKGDRNLLNIPERKQWAGQQRRDFLLGGGPGG